MTDPEITRLCAEAIGFVPYYDQDNPANRELIQFNPLRDDAQAMALVKKLSINIHHHGCAAHKASLVTVSGHWEPYSKEFKVCGTDLNRAICECVAKMQQAKP